MYKTQRSAGVSTTSQRGSGRVQGRHSKAVTHFHPPRTPAVSRQLVLPRPATSPVPTTQTQRSSDGSAVLCSPCPALDDSHVDNNRLPLSQEVMRSRSPPKTRARCKRSELKSKQLERLTPRPPAKKIPRLCLIFVACGLFFSSDHIKTHITSLH